MTRSILLHSSSDLPIKGQPVQKPAPAWKHALISLALAIILGAGAALTAHFLLANQIVWTAVAGVGVALITGIALYALIRYIVKEKGAPVPKNWNGLIIKEVKTYPGDLEKGSKVSANQIDEQTLQFKFENTRFSVTLRQQDLFASGAQVIVNAANNHLQGGGGIDGQINSLGGEEYSNEQSVALRGEYDEKGYVNGHAAMLGSGALKKSHGIDNIIVVSGPSGETTAQKENELYSCYYSSLELAHNHHKTSIALPTISTGIFGFDKSRAAAISLRAISDFITNYPKSPLRTISIHYQNPAGGTKESYQAAVDSLK